MAHDNDTDIDISAQNDDISVDALVDVEEDVDAQSTPETQDDEDDLENGDTSSNSPPDQDVLEKLLSSGLDPHKIRITGLCLDEINQLLQDLDQNGMPKRLPNSIIIHNGAVLFDSIDSDNISALQDLCDCEIEFCYEPELATVKNIEKNNSNVELFSVESGIDSSILDYANEANASLSDDDDDEL